MNSIEHAAGALIEEEAEGGLSLKAAVREGTSKKKKKRNQEED